MRPGNLFSMPKMGGSARGRERVGGRETQAFAEKPKARGLERKGWAMGPQSEAP